MVAGMSELDDIFISFEASDLFDKAERLAPLQSKNVRTVLRAARLYSRAAVIGHRPAKLRLGAFYARGDSPSFNTYLS